MSITIQYMCSDYSPPEDPSEVEIARILGQLDSRGTFTLLSSIQQGRSGITSVPSLNELPTRLFAAVHAASFWVCIAGTDLEVETYRRFLAGGWPLLRKLWPFMTAALSRHEWIVIPWGAPEYYALAVITRSEPPPAARSSRSTIINSDDLSSVGRPTLLTRSPFDTTAEVFTDNLCNYFVRDVPCTVVAPAYRAWEWLAEKNVDATHVIDSVDLGKLGNAFEYGDVVAITGRDSMPARVILAASFDVNVGCIATDAPAYLLGEYLHRLVDAAYYEIPGLLPANATVVSTFGVPNSMAIVRSPRIAVWRDHAERTTRSLTEVVCVY